MKDNAGVRKINDENCNIEGIEVREFDDAVGLFQELSTVQIPTGKDHVFNPLCRGQADYKWGLTPGILRDNNRLLNVTHSSAGISKGSIETEIDLVKSELKLIDLFLGKADEIGLAVPSDSLVLRQKLADFSRLVKLVSDYPENKFQIEDLEKSPPWPWAEALSIMSLMQHYGLPTRLLDWTKSPLHAAFFAAKQAMELGLTNGYIGVYVLSESGFVEWKENWYEDDKLLIVTPPTAGNSNLINQCSGQLFPDSFLSFSSAKAGGNPALF